VGAFDPNLLDFLVLDLEVLALANELHGLPLTVKLAQTRLAYSRMPFVRAYFRETQETVFDAHDRAISFYGGVFRRGIYDNMRTAVEAVFVGHARVYNRRFLQLCSHHLLNLWPVRRLQVGGKAKSRTRLAVKSAMFAAVS